MSQKTLEEIRDEKSVSIPYSMPNEERLTFQRVYKNGWNAAQAEMINRAQVLVNFIEEIKNESSCEYINIKADNILDQWKESIK
ncbi:MAG: hypothetical protein IPQ08_06295 [Chitinophagaceae bacterium]|nr:hypothetical protein [Chitinophagaceae bacterium]